MTTIKDLEKPMFKELVEEQARNIRKAAQECEAGMSNSTTSLGNCPQMFDNMMCWPESAPDQLNTLPCPSYIVGFIPEKFATKLCTAEGEWFVSPATNRTWTNFTQCYTGPYKEVLVRHFPSEDISYVVEYLPMLNTLSTVGFSVSFVTLIVAFCIFAYFKRLRCPRNKMHMHLFASFMLRAGFTLFKDAIFVGGAGLPSDFIVHNGKTYFNHSNKKSWQCKMIMTIWHYCHMVNYSWIFQEGLYLHQLIFSAFSDSSSIALFIVLGWSLPILFVVPWVLVRAYWEDTYCWTSNENFLHVQLIKAPIAASVLINVFLFLNIVRVLLSKLNASISEESRRFRYRKWAKSTLVLMPLFGVHYIIYLTVDYLGVRGKEEVVWVFVDHFFGCFQGCFVGILYCLMNGEVRAELARKWRGLPSFRNSNDRHRPSLAPSGPNGVSQQPVKRSYRGSVFSRRQGPRQAQQNGFKRGSSVETCMSPLVSKVATETATNTTSFVTHNSFLILKKGGSVETCMSPLVSREATETTTNTTSFVTHNPHSRKSMGTMDNSKNTTTLGADSQLLA